MKVVLKGPVTVVTEVSFPHLSSGRAASARPGNHQTDPRRPAMPAPGTEDPRFTAPASKGEELKSFRVGRQRKEVRPDSIYSCLSETGKVASAARTWENRLGSAFLTSVTQRNNISAERTLLPRVCRSSDHTKQRPQRANVSQPPPAPQKVQQKPSNVQTGGARGPLHGDFNPKPQPTSTSNRTEIPPCPSLQGKEEMQQLLKDAEKADLTRTASGKLLYQR